MFWKTVLLSFWIESIDHEAPETFYAVENYYSYLKIFDLKIVIIILQKLAISPIIAKCKLLTFN